MKRFITILIATCLILSLTIPAFAEEEVYYLDDYAIDEDYYRDNSYKGTVLNVYNWGEYISDGSEDSLDVNKYFEELTGIKVNYTNFDSNEDMYAKIKSGGANYDVVIPSDYMIQRMAEEGMLLPLDYD
ncbi:MAG: extracellular solute-binding protein, partial [Clostridia bacterium]|nr:extracellular solute-binding protein [Clostridia bacterium]